MPCARRSRLRPRRRTPEPGRQRASDAGDDEQRDRCSSRASSASIALRPPSSGQLPPQQPPAPPQPPAINPQLPTFRTGANIVRVDVTVLDHRGNPVPALKAEDFLIEEDGVPQKVTLAEVHRGERAA